MQKQAYKKHPPLCSSGHFSTFAESFSISSLTTLVLLATSYVVILYSTTRFFHKKGFMYGAIYFLWVKHGSTWLDTSVVKAVECGVLKTGMHCKKILCTGYISSQSSGMWSAENWHALQENPLHLSKSVFCVQCLENEMGSIALGRDCGVRIFSVSAIITHCIWHSWCLWKFKNKINGLHYWVVFYLVHPAYVF